MKNSIHLAFLLVIVLALLSVASLVCAFDNKYEKETLRGIQALHVIVHDLDPEIEEFGLTKEKVKQDLEAKLRTAGIKLISKEESLKAPGAPFLSLMVGTLRAFTTKDTEFYFVSIVIKLRQSVYLERKSKTKIPGIATWSHTRFGINFAHNIRSEVNSAIDKFIDAYLSVNPK